MRGICGNCLGILVVLVEEYIRFQLPLCRPLKTLDKEVYNRQVPYCKDTTRGIGLQYGTETLAHHQKGSLRSLAK